MKIDPDALGVLIATTIADQNGGNDNVDNLGDGESIIITSVCPVVNVAELTEKILQYIGENYVRE